MRRGFDPRRGKILCRRKWQATPVFLPEKFYGQRSLVGWSLWGCKESDTAEGLSATIHSNAPGHEELGCRIAQTSTDRAS